MTRLSLLAALSLACATASGLVPRQAVPRNSAAPSVRVKNGSYYGVYSQTYDQDLFLGIPYAQPPVENLRFRPPQPLNSTWDGARNATEYSPQCFGYGSDTWVLGNYVSEDCLTINVVRPHGISPDADLPVAVWIHGGGLANGGSSDPRYNLSFIVEQSVRMGTPFIATSINYRLHAWGFLWSHEIKAAGAGNLGFRDQRLALSWVSENIASFGGNPDHVTIWGESAGARSVDAQMLAYGGRDNGLFHAAILESGTGFGTNFGEVETGDVWQEYYDTIVNSTNCSSAADTLECLRELPAWDLSNVLNSTSNPSFRGVADGDFLEAPFSDLVNQGKFARVPILIGANFDEGTGFATKGINTTAQWASNLRTAFGAGNTTIEDLSVQYPDIPALGIPATFEGRPTGPLAFWGAQFKRVAAFAGDVGYHGPRRYVARKWAEAGLAVYSYHFNVLVNGAQPIQGAMHFQEVAFVFNNTGGLGYDTVVSKNPFGGDSPASLFQLANVMSRMWVSFITTGDPNHGGAAGFDVAWPRYDAADPRNIVFDVNVSSLAYVEPDTYRAEPMEYLAQRLWA